MTNLIRTEFMKLKKSNVWTFVAIIPVISILFGSGNYYMNREILQNQWHSLWTQVSLFYSFFFLCHYYCNYSFL